MSAGSTLAAASMLFPACTRLSFLSGTLARNEEAPNRCLLSELLGDQHVLELPALVELATVPVAEGKSVVARSTAWDK